MQHGRSVSLLRRSAPLFLASTLLLLPAAASAQPATGVAVMVAPFLPRWADDGGWGLVAAGGAPGKWIAFTNADQAEIPPGTYDFYWIQDAVHTEWPMLMQEDVVVAAGAVTEITVDTGITVALADWVPPLEPGVGYWVALDENNGNRITNVTSGDVMVLPAGQYLFTWQADGRDDIPPLPIDNRTIEPPFGGIGAEVRTIEGEVVVTRALDGRPAALAGIEAGDIILTAGDTALTGMPIEEATSHLRGPAGSTVTVGIRRGTETISLDVTRDLAAAAQALFIVNGVELIPDVTVPPLGEGGWWGAAASGLGGAEARIAWTDDIGATLLLGYDTYDIYWTEDADAVPILVASEVTMTSGIIRIPIGTAEISGGVLPPKPDR